MAMWSMYTIGLRWPPAGLHMLSFLFVISCIGDVAYCRSTRSRRRSGQPCTGRPRRRLRSLCVALFSSVLAYIFWNRGVEQVGANVAGLFVHLMPVFGVVLAWFFLDERLAPFHVAGIALILCGIYITSRFAPDCRSRGYGLVNPGQRSGQRCISRESLPGPE